MESLPHPPTLGILHQATVDDLKWSCGTRCIDERGCCWASASSLPLSPLQPPRGAKGTAATTQVLAAARNSASERMAVSPEMVLSASTNRTMKQLVGRVLSHNLRPSLQHRASTSVELPEDCRHNGHARWTSSSLELWFILSPNTLPSWRIILTLSNNRISKKSLGGSPLIYGVSEIRNESDQWLVIMTVAYKVWTKIYTVWHAAVCNATLVNNGAMESWGK